GWWRNRFLFAHYRVGPNAIDSWTRSAYSRTNTSTLVAMRRPCVPDMLRTSSNTPRWLALPRRVAQNAPHGSWPSSVTTTTFGKPYAGLLAPRFTRRHVFVGRPHWARSGTCAAMPPRGAPGRPG